MAAISFFVGLIAPNIARMLVGNNHKWTLPVSGLVRAIALLPFCLRIRSRARSGRSRRTDRYYHYRSVHLLLLILAVKIRLRGRAQCGLLSNLLAACY
ncbi:iron chelate uptake ABC transporter family permease subunit [Cohnella sp. GCM10012308]|uniref:iron chelate uptake ABC transporter family permease subunit n=1 Tax=Cohnella sp. GCM10012308 TaxID=3317329 RepID=UPI003612C073